MAYKNDTWLKAGIQAAQALHKVPPGIECFRNPIALFPTPHGWGITFLEGLHYFDHAQSHTLDDVCNLTMAAFECPHFPISHEDIVTTESPCGAHVELRISHRPTGLSRTVALTDDTRDNDKFVRERTRLNLYIDIARAHHDSQSVQ